MRTVVVFLAVSLAALGACVGAAVFAASSFINSPFPVSSSAGLSVFSFNGQLVSYPYYAAGPEVTAVGACVILVVAAVVLGAALSMRRVY
jgi:hypothetical protein